MKALALVCVAAVLGGCAVDAGGAGDDNLGQIAPQDPNAATVNAATVSETTDTAEQQYARRFIHTDKLSPEVQVIPSRKNPRSPSPGPVGPGPGQE